MVRDNKRKNYWPSLVVTLVWWGLVMLIVLMIDPQVVADFPLPGTYGVFIFFLFLAIWFTMSLVLVNTRRGLLIAIGVVILAYLKLWKVLSLFNFAILVGMVVAFEYYFSGGKPEEKNKVDSLTDDL